MLPCSIRARLLGLVVAAIVPFTLLTGIGLWNQWQSEHAAAIQRALNEARLIAAQVDDHIGNLDNLLMGLSRAVSTDPATGFIFLVRRAGSSDAFDGTPRNQTGSRSPRRRDRSQYYKDLAVAFYGANRPGAKASQGTLDQFWLWSIDLKESRDK